MPSTDSNNVDTTRPITTTFLPPIERRSNTPDIPPLLCDPLNGRGTPQNTLRIGGVVTAVVASVAALILFFFDPARTSFYPICMFHQVTGLQCPGCGGLRALHQLLHGHILAALHLNVLAVVSVPILAFIGAMLTLRRVRQAPFALATRPAWLLWAFSLVVAFGILRNLPFEPFTWLAPP
jgi:hypothetical protein